jgi:hypothetical protein
MPSHYDEMPKSREGSRGLEPDDIRSLLEEGIITPSEAEEMLAFYETLVKQVERQTPSRPPVPQKKPTQPMQRKRPAPIPRRKPPAPARALGGMVKSKSRTGHTDYRKGGMVHNTKVKKG